MAQAPMPVPGLSTMKGVYDSATQVKDTVLGTDPAQGGKSVSSGVEPPSGQTGEGTLGNPHDQGNAPGRLLRSVPSPREFLA